MSEKQDQSSFGGRLYRGEVSIDFVGRRKQWYLVSLALFIISVGAFLFQGMKLGIEFSGGTVLTVTSTQADASNARETVTQLPFIEGLIVQELGTDKVQIRTESLEPAELTEIQDLLSSRYAIDVESIDVQSIGPSWGEEITRKGITGLVAFFIIVMLYLAMTFEPKMAFAAFIALFRDSDWMRDVGIA